MIRYKIKDTLNAQYSLHGDLRGFTFEASHELVSRIFGHVVIPFKNNARVWISFRADELELL